MTTDAFTTAARKEAQLASLDRNGRIGGVGDLGAHMAEWARDHLARQEVTDAEVEAAANAILAYEGETEETAHGDLIDAAWDHARAALSAARHARTEEDA